MSRGEHRIASATTESSNFVNALSKTLGAANAYLASLLNDAGLSNLVPSHGEILMQLFARETMTMQDIASVIGRDPSTITSLVRKLIDSGFVSTKKSDADKRITEVSLTAKGRKMQEEFACISSKLRNAQMKGIDIEEFRIACCVLDKIRGNFEHALEDNGQVERICR